MNLQVFYFARLRECFACAQETLHLNGDQARVADLLDVLRARGGVWADELAAGRAFRVAVNQDVAALDASLRAGDEVAIFPPVTGG